VPLDSLPPERKAEFEQTLLGLMQRRTQPDVGSRTRASTCSSPESAASTTLSGILSGLMTERRPTKSELRLRRLTEEDPEPERRGILEIFAEDEPADEDAPLVRDDEPDHR
jgi:hypothetical protein